MNSKQVKMEDSWKEVLSDEFEKKYFDEIKQGLLKSRAMGRKVYPPGPLIFNAFNSTPFQNTKVIIVGQDPYHGPGEAMGLCFSVPKGIRVPPSLKNIYKELNTDLGHSIPTHGDLSDWAQQGVFLLNAILTVEHKRPASHRSIGWEQFTDKVIQTLSKKKEGLIFLLWGRYAQSKSSLINQAKHYVLLAPHPSPLARGGFFDCRHFSKTNELLVKQDLEPVDWQII